ncbi:hypothetical protein DICPUDRAFT_27785, partial [Dictyostelium purpureum]
NYRGFFSNKTMEDFLAFKYIKDFFSIKAIEDFLAHKRFLAFKLSRIFYH